MDTKKYSELAPLFLRIGVGIIFIVAGWGKVTGLWGALFSGEEWGFVGAVANIGFPFPFLFAGIVAVIEFFGGIMVLLGYKIRIPVLLLAGVMLVAIFGVKLDDGFNAARLDFMLLLASLALVFSGSGSYSVDDMLGRK